MRNFTQQIRVMVCNGGSQKMFVWFLLFILLPGAHARAQEKLLKDINTISAPLGSSAVGFTEFNNVLFFAAKSAGHGIELWKTDGTPAGTVLVKDIEEGP